MPDTQDNESRPGGAAHGADITTEHPVVVLGGGPAGLTAA